MARVTLRFINVLASGWGTYHHLHALMGHNLLLRHATLHKYFSMEENALCCTVFLKPYPTAQLEGHT